MATLSVSSETAVVEVVRAARETRRTLEIVGHGTKRGFGRPLECDDVLDLSGLTGIVTYESDEMIITARAGTSVAEIEAALAEHNQRLGFGPPDWSSLLYAYNKSATIGGVLSANANGSAAVRYGRCRDHLLGFRAVNGFGEAYKGGGKVVKNVTGFDLPKLFCGAMGTLGPLTEVTLRVFPIPPLSVVFEIEALTFPQAAPLLHRLWTSALEPTCLAYVPAVAAQELGLAENAILVRLEGSAAHQKEQNKILRELAGRHNVAENEDGNAIIKALGDGMPFHCNSLGVRRVAIAPSQAAAFVAELDPPMWFADWAGGLLWVGVKGNTASIHDLAARYHAYAVQIRPDDHAAASELPFPPEPPVRAELTKRVKAAFDPLRLFNPGRMWEGV
ncbi:MAG TPA: FAD-binding protein [Rhizomicrobium sp.]|jgi:glycolate oxidase FAD binding subunit|nr:FAD-binding protein [Rhizomicrobium sp.]